MFAGRYFPNRYFADRYWPKVGATAATPITGAGLEYAVPEGHMHYTAQGLPHSRVPQSRMHYRAPAERR